MNKYLQFFLKFRLNKLYFIFSRCIDGKPNFVWSRRRDKINIPHRSTHTHTQTYP